MPVGKGLWLRQQKTGKDFRSCRQLSRDYSCRQASIGNDERFSSTNSSTISVCFIINSFEMTTKKKDLQIKARPASYARMMFFFFETHSGKSNKDSISIFGFEFPISKQENRNVFFFSPSIQIRQQRTAAKHCDPSSQRMELSQTYSA